MFGKQGQHVVEKGDAGLDGRFSRPVNFQIQPDPRFLGDAVDLGLPDLHWLLIGAVRENDNVQSWEAGSSRIIAMGLECRGVLISTES